ncbi:MAG: inositol monophosphatase family protein [Chitinophagales bacterium]
MRTLQPEALCKDAMHIIRETGNYIRERRKQFASVSIAKKGVRDFVTEVDTYSEKVLIEKLGALVPGSTFIAEENTVEAHVSEYTWIIDPLDGTMNYVHGIPVYAISVALQENGKTIVGIVFEMVQDEMFCAWEGSDAFCNGEKIQVSGCAQLKDALIATGFPYIRTPERTRALANTLQYFLDEGRDIRRLGTAATDLCYIACGRLDVYYEGYLNIWDIAAGIFIVQQAGGVAVNFKGQTDFSEGNVLAANPALIETSLQGIQFA